LSTVLIRRPAFIQALSSRAFALVWSGQTISAIGDGAFNTALAWQVLVLTGSASALGAVMLAQTLPMLGFVLFGGVVADRFERRKVMLVSDFGRALAVLLIAVLSFLNLLELWHLVGLALFFGSVKGFFSPAYQSLVPQLVNSPEDLASANSLTEFTTQVYMLAGPIIGAVSISLGNIATAFAFDSLTFCLSALCLLAVRLPGATGKALTPENEVRPGVKGVFLDLKQGWSYVTGQPVLWITIGIAAVLSVPGAGAFLVTLPKLVKDFYHQDVWLLGIIGLAGGAGTILGAIVTNYINRLGNRGLNLYLSMMGASAGILLFVLPLPSELQAVAACLGMASFSLGSTIHQIMWMTYLQEKVPDDKLGRVSSIDLLGNYGLWPLGFLLAGVLGDNVSPTLIFIIAGALGVGLYGAGLFSRRIRQLR
jgi:DHA3 family tetracycline resistance protein-like MFS transporter